LDNNQISTITNGAFSGLTALSRLYGAGLWGLGYLLFFLLDAFIHDGAFLPNLLKACFLL
jgi:hypothetical protein